MKLAPRIIQAMEVLQLPMMALQERIDAEMEANPVLEMGADQVQEADEPVLESPVSDQPVEQKDIVIAEDNRNSDDFERLADFSDEYGDDVVSSSAPAGGFDVDRDRKLDVMSNTPANDQSLDEYLLNQWSFMEISGDIRQAGELILSNLDMDGYLRVPMGELLNQTKPPLDPQAFATALKYVQTLEPAGTGARDLRECLLLQLEQKQSLNDDFQLEMELVRQHLREIERNHLPLIAKRTGKSIEDVKQAIETLSHLNPCPGLLIGQRIAPVITPDVIVAIDENDDPVVTMADGNTPRLYISDEYRRLARNRKTDRDAKKFLQKNIRSAKWIIEAIQQRRYTIQRVGQEIFNVQKGFLREGKQALKPLPMAYVAEKVGIHVATVSRAVSGKYAQTPQGIYPLRMFFSGGIKSQQGQDVAWDAVKVKLKEIIDSEDKKKPLNDAQIAEELDKRGVEIARRTVVKYRKIMNIPPARKRKEY